MFGKLLSSAYISTSALHKWATPSALITIGSFADDDDDDDDGDIDDDDDDDDDNDDDDDDDNNEEECQTIGMYLKNYCR